MSLTLITLIAWAPFLLLALIFGTIFCIKGYKRGSARAGISIAVTALSCLFAVLLAKLLSGSIASIVEPFLTDALSEAASGIDMSAITPVAMGAASALAALIIYIPIFILLVSILKPVVSLIVKRFIPKAKHIANKLGGLAISLVDALLLALLVLIPLYGTLSIAKNAKPLLKNEKGVYGYLSAATDPFIVDIAGVPPFSTAYDALLSFDIDGANFNISGTIRSGLTLYNDVNKFLDLKNKFSDEKLLISLLSNAENILLSNEYAVELLCSIATEKIPDFEIPKLGKISISNYYVSLNDGKLLKEDLPAFFDLARAMIDSGMLKELNAGKNFNIDNINATKISNAFGKTFNHSTAIASFKSRLVKDLVSVYMDEIIEAGNDKDGTVKALKDAVLAIPDTPFGSADAKKEGESLFMIMSGALLQGNGEGMDGKAMGYLIEGLARHPAIGTATVMNAAGAFLGSSDSEGTVTDELLNKFEDKLNEAVTKPVGQSKFPEFVDTAFDTIGALDDIQNGNTDSDSIKDLITADPEAIQSMKDVLSKDILEDVGMGEMSDKMYDVIDSVFDSIIDTDLTEEEAEKESEALFEMMTVLVDVAEDPEGTRDLIRDKADDLIGFCADSKILANTLENLTKDGESDPTGIFSELDDTAKDEINSKIDSYIAENGNSDALEALKQFIGLK